MRTCAPQKKKVIKIEINGWNIAQAEARQHQVVIGNNSVKNNSEWDPASPVPIMNKSDIGFKSLKIVLIIKGCERNDILLNRSTILAKLIDPVTIQLDKNNHMFYGILTKYDAEETSRHWHKLSLEFDCYECGPETEEIHSNKTEINIQNEGNIVTPCVIEITPQIGAVSITINGICRDEAGEDLPVTIKNVAKEKTIVLDGEQGLMTVDGKLDTDNITIWGLPSLLPGKNKIACSSNWMDIKIKWKARFM